MGFIERFELREEAEIVVAAVDEIGFIVAVSAGDFEVGHESNSSSAP